MRKKFCRTEEVKKKSVYNRRCKRCDKIYETPMKKSQYCWKCYTPFGKATMKGKMV